MRIPYYDIVFNMIGTVVLDTSVVVAGLCSPRGASHVLLRLVLEGLLRTAASVPLFLEYEAALSDARIRRLHGLKRAEVAAFLDGLAEAIVPVRLHYLWRPQLGDPGDEMVLETAVSANAQWIVTFNRRDFGVAVDRFGVEIALPGDFLRRHRDALRLPERRGL